ncbi:M24 family metallopeptidase [Pseudoalteromonas fenneropenaei]|uniref:M24 family metallopeptidase n=1 Tax=Pseudoalteromonas fenneropenaei TaxID=1737459 RepID=A0ABV7CFP6_9GAMM
MNAMYLERQRKAQALLQQRELDALLVLGYENIRYLTGYSGNAAYLLLTPQENILITDYRYYQRALQETHGALVVERDREAESLGACLQRHFAKGVVGFESASVSVAVWQDIANTLTGWQCQACNGLIESLRTVKEHWEVASIRKAAAIADEALAETLKLVKAGVAERDLAIELDYRMKQLGSDGVSFDTILLFGARSSLPHGKPGDTRLQHGDMLLVDFGAVVNGYRSDMTRTYVLGEASAKQQHIFDAVFAAQQASFALLKAGTDCKTLNAASERVLAEFGYSEFAGKGLGHGVGLFLHETPFINRSTDYQLQAGNVITIEPGVYIPALGGVRLEDDVLITEQGFEFLTHAPKQFVLQGG